MLGSTSGKAKERRSEMVVDVGVETEGARRKEAEVSGASRGGEVVGNPEKLKLCLRSGGRWTVGLEVWERACASSSSAL